MKPVLYLLMRNDLESMTPGKLAAQASHVSNAFVKGFQMACMHTVLDGERTGRVVPDGLVRLFNIWENSTKQGFGTAITLSVSSKEIMEMESWLLNHLEKNNKNINVIFGRVYDPTYPYKIPKAVADDLLLELNSIDHIDAEKGIYTRKELVGAFFFIDADNPDMQWIKEFPLW